MSLSKKNLDKLNNYIKNNSLANDHNISTSKNAFGNPAKNKDSTK